MPWLCRYCDTEPARRSDSDWLYASSPVLSVWPATSSSVLSNSFSTSETEFSTSKKSGCRSELSVLNVMLPGHVQRDVVADARDAHARALKLLAQLRFLPIHVLTDGAAGQCADARADQRALATLARVVARENAGHRARQRADAGALGRRADLADYRCKRRWCSSPRERRSSTAAMSPLHIKLLMRM